MGLPSRACSAEREGERETCHGPSSPFLFQLGLSAVDVSSRRPTAFSFGWGRNGRWRGAASPEAASDAPSRAPPLAVCQPPKPLARCTHRSAFKLAVAGQAGAGGAHKRHAIVQPAARLRGALRRRRRTTRPSTAELLSDIPAVFSVLAQPSCDSASIRLVLSCGDHC